MNSKIQDSRLSPRFPTRYQPPIASARSVVETHGKPVGHHDLSSGLRSRKRQLSSAPQRLHAALQNITAPPTFVINNNGGHISMGAVLSSIPAPHDKVNTPNTAPNPAAEPPPTPAASLPTNDLRRSIKRRYEPLELVSTTAPPGTLPRLAPLSKSKKRNLRADRHRRELRLQAHAASAQINALSTHTDKLDRFLVALDSATLRHLPASADTPPPAYLPAPGVDAFLSTTASRIAAFGPLPDNHALLQRPDASASSAGLLRLQPPGRAAPPDGAPPPPSASPSPLGPPFSPTTPSVSPPMQPARLDNLGAHVLLARQAWRDSYDFRPYCPPDRTADTPTLILSRTGNHAYDARQNWLTFCASKAQPRAPDRAAPSTPPTQLTPPETRPRPVEPRPAVNPLDAAQPARPGPSHPELLRAPAPDAPPTPLAPTARPETRPPGPALAALQNRLRDTVRSFLPDLNLLEHYGQPQLPGIRHGGAASPPAVAAGDGSPPSPPRPGDVDTSGSLPNDGPSLPGPTDPSDPDTAPASLNHDPAEPDAEEPPSLTPTEELLPGYREESRHDSPRLDEIHPILPTPTTEHTPPPVNRTRPSARLQLGRRPHAESPTIGSRLAGSKRRTRGRETDSAAGSSGSDSPPDRHSTFRDFRLSPPPSQRQPAPSRAAQPPRVTRSSALPPPLPKLKWHAPPTRRAAPDPST
jgi:hypothetical protein